MAHTLTHPPAGETRLARLMLIAAAALSVGLSLSFFVGAGYDDSWISLWSGETLARQGMLLNHNGQPVEIASSLLHVFLVALFERLAPSNAFLLNKAAGMLAGVATLGVLFWQRALLFGALPAAWRTPALGIALMTLATHPSWLNWNLGGLETPYQTLLLTLYFAYLTRYVARRSSPLPLIVIQCLYVLVRSEGFMLLALTVAALGLAHLLQRGRLSLRQSLLCVGAPLLLAVGLLALRFELFGLLAPAPAYAKAGALGDLLAGLPYGIEYIRDYHLSSPLTLVQLVLLLGAATAVVIPALAGKKRAGAAGVMAIGLLLIAWNHAAVMLVRGDWMTYFRFVVPIVPVICVVAALALAEGLSGLKKQQQILPALALAGMLALSTTNQWQNPRSYVTSMPVSSTQRSIIDLFEPAALPFKERVLRLNASYTRDATDALPFLRDALPGLNKTLNTKRLVIASYQIGYVPYITKQMHPNLDIEFVDTMGLATPEIARMPLPKFVWGVVDGDKLDKIVAGEMPPLSAYVLGRDVNMLYFIAITPEQRARLAQHGWQLLWDRPGAIFWGKRQAP